MTKIRLGEKPFLSIQGEGARTGVLSVWVRFFGCNLTCSGFGQVDPTNPATYELPYKDIEIKMYRSMEDLPVFDKGCDSGYSWAPKFKKLALDYQPHELVTAITDLLPEGNFFHPVTENEIDLCFTGGEPMMHQKSMIQILDTLEPDNHPYIVQIETNGTKAIQESFKDYIFGFGDSMVQWNISPKLFYVSGEKDVDAWKPEVIKEMLSQPWTYDACLKFVVNNDQRCWDELNRKVRQLRDMGVFAPVYVMPVGATKKDQENIYHVGEIAKKAIANGYHVSGRIHATLFGNGIGT